ncbi:accelerated cell death 11-like [Castanea sativa]|uniref:accelerated cell death 11-like n=1 Tax=Castanea sativa TaxID=21020 RepID=UPI003F64E20E
MAARDNPLRKLADAIEGLSSSVNSENPHLKISDVVHVCRLSTPSIFFLGIAFKFADWELQSKVNDLEEASKTYDTVQALLEAETENGSAKNTGSHSRNLVRLKRVIDLVRVMLEQVLASGGNSLVEPFTAAYEQVFAPYHGWTVKKAVIAALKVLPSKDLLLPLLNEDDDSVKESMQKYITASKSVLQYVDNIFLSTETGAELLKLI